MNQQFDPAATPAQVGQWRAIRSGGVTVVRAALGALAARASASLIATAAGATSFEIGSVLLPALLVGTLHATPAALGVIEGLAIGAGSVARLAGGTVVHHARRRRFVNVGGYAGVAALTGAGRRPSSARGGGGRARTGPRHFQSFEQARLEADREPVAVDRTAAGAQDRLMRRTRPYGSMIRATSAPTSSPRTTPERQQIDASLMPRHGRDRAGIGSTAGILRWAMLGSKPRSSA